LKNITSKIDYFEIIVQQNKGKYEYLTEMY